MEPIQKETGCDEGEALTDSSLIDISYYTDPLCCWSWALEPQWRRLQFEFEGKFRWRYYMGGLIPSWNNFNDSVNLVSRPIQMGPIWMEAGHVSGMQIDNRVWMQDPPASSYPACIAVNCAFLQHAEAGNKFLRALREAVMIEGKNTARLTVLDEVAVHISSAYPQFFNLAVFREDMKNDRGIDAFRAHVQEARNRNITRFPSLIFRAEKSPPIIVTGYQRYADLVNALNHMVPGLRPSRKADNQETYRHYWDSITQRELDEINHSNIDG